MWLGQDLWRGGKTNEQQKYDNCSSHGSGHGPELYCTLFDSSKAGSLTKVELDPRGATIFPEVYYPSNSGRVRRQHTILLWS